MNTVIMCHVHHLSTEMRVKCTLVPKSTPTDTSQDSLTILISDVNVYPTI